MCLLNKFTIFKETHLSALHSIIYFFKHFLLEVDEHSLHSPFLFQLYTDVIRPARHKPLISEIEELRTEFLKSNRIISFEDPGAGSKRDIRGRKNKLLRRIVRDGITPAKYSGLMTNMIGFFKCYNLLELGTSIGINTLYLSRTGKNTKVYTMEGVHTLAITAKENFNSLNAENIELLEGNIDHLLTDFLGEIEQIDFAFIDANHRYKSTILYHDLIRDHLRDPAIVIIDDIYWSPEMTRAWKEISFKNRHFLFIDLYRMGLIIYKSGIPGGYYRLAF